MTAAPTHFITTYNACNVKFQGGGAVCETTPMPMRQPARVRFLFGGALPPEAFLPARGSLYRVVSCTSSMHVSLFTRDDCRNTPMPASRSSRNPSLRYGKCLELRTALRKLIGGLSLSSVLIALWLHIPEALGAYWLNRATLEGVAGEGSEMVSYKLEVTYARQSKDVRDPWRRVAAISLTLNGKSVPIPKDAVRELHYAHHPTPLHSPEPGLFVLNIQTGSASKTYCYSFFFSKNQLLRRERRHYLEPEPEQVVRYAP
jgi:hypothetical protein